MIDRITRPNKKAREEALKRMQDLPEGLSGANPEAAEPSADQPETVPQESMGHRATPANPDSLRSQRRTGLQQAIANYNARRTKDATQGTALYRGMEKVQETGSLGLELAKQVESMKTMIDTRVVKMFSIMDEASGRALNGEAYLYDPATDEIKAIDDADFNQQLKATMRAASEFAHIVEVLPQEIATLVTELEDAERAFGAVLLREPIPSPSIPPTISPWNPREAAQSSTTETFGHVIPTIPDQPAFEHGARETEHVFNVASNILDAVHDLKRRVDAQTIHILNTINEAATRALNGEAYTDAGGQISAVVDDPNLVNRLETTVRTAQDLIGIMERLPSEIQTLINEIRDAEKKFFSVLQGNAPRV